MKVGSAAVLWAHLGCPNCFGPTFWECWLLAFQLKKSVLVSLDPGNPKKQQGGPIELLRDDKSQGERSRFLSFCKQSTVRELSPGEPYPPPALSNLQLCLDCNRFANKSYVKKVRKHTIFKGFKCAEERSLPKPQIKNSTLCQLGIPSLPLSPTLTDGRCR